MTALTMMDGAGSGFSACVAVDGTREMLAVGTKTGTVHLLDFRPNDASPS